MSLMWLLWENRAKKELYLTHFCKKCISNLVLLYEFYKT